MNWRTQQIYINDTNYVKLLIAVDRKKCQEQRERDTWQVYELHVWYTNLVKNNYKNNRFWWLSSKYGIFYFKAFYKFPNAWWFEWSCKIYINICLFVINKICTAFEQHPTFQFLKMQSIIHNTFFQVITKHRGLLTLVRISQDIIEFQITAPR